MSIEKCKDFEKDGYGTWDDSSKPTTFANMHDFMKNQNNVTLALANGLWQPSTDYSVGAIVHSPSLPAGCKATCTTAGTTGSTEPMWTAYGTTVTDGTVKWKIETDVQSTIMNEVTDAINRKIVSGTGSGSGSIDLSAYAKKADLNSYAPLASPVFTGIPKAPTADAGTNTTQIATTAFVATAISNASVGSGSESIDLSAYAKKTDLSAYQTKLTFDTTPTANSNNPVTSGGIKTWVEAKGYLTTHQDISGKQDKLTFDTTPTANSTNPVTSGGIKSYVDSKVSSSGGSGSVDLSGYQTKLTFDTTPTADSTNPVTSGGIKTALDGKPSNTGAGASGTWGINISGTASTATKATQDDYGHVISTTYATKADLRNYYTKAQVDSAISTAISAIVDGDSKSY